MGCTILEQYGQDANGHLAWFVQVILHDNFFHLFKGGL